MCLKSYVNGRGSNPLTPPRYATGHEEVDPEKKINCISSATNVVLVVVVVHVLGILALSFLRRS